MLFRILAPVSRPDAVPMNCAENPTSTVGVCGHVPADDGATRSFSIAVNGVAAIAATAYSHTVTTATDNPVAAPRVDEKTDTLVSHRRGRQVQSCRTVVPNKSDRLSFQPAGCISR